MSRLNNIEHLTETISTKLDNLDINDINEIQTVRQIDNLTNIFSIQSLEQVQDVFDVHRILEVPYDVLEMRRGRLPGITTLETYAKTTTDNANWKTIYPGSVNNILPIIPIGGISMSFTPDFLLGPPVINFFFNVVAYVDEDATTPVSFNISTNGTNTILLPQNIFRFVSITVLPGVLPQQCEVYFHLTGTPIVGGIPTIYYDYMAVGDDPLFGNTRETAIYYNPPNATTYTQSWWVTVDQNDSSVREICFRLIQPSTPDFHWQKVYYVTNANWQTNVFNNVPPGHTVHVMAREARGNNFTALNFNSELIRVNTVI